MLNFIKYVFASFIGLVIFFMFLLILGIGVIALVSGDKKTVIAEKSVIKINLDKVIREREQQDWTALNFLFGKNERNIIGLYEIKEALKIASKNEKIKGIYIEVNHPEAGLATLQELRKSLLEFKNAGKFIVAYGEAMREKGYYLASVADKVIIPESGIIEFNGLHTELLYFKGLLEKLDLKPQIFKSAVEVYDQDHMSEANRLQIKQLLNSIYMELLNDIAVSRTIDVNDLKLISDSMLVTSPQGALTNNLITDVGYYDAVESFIRDKVGLTEKEEISFISYTTLLANDDLSLKKEANKIAVVFAEGEIVDGKGEMGQIGSDQFVKTIRKLKKDEAVKAVVLRINSPGGSALASDLIWNEVLQLSKSKPIIASMSDVAASGGYYIAMACDTIVANTTTVTGSIGVLGVLINGGDFLKNKLGITTDREKTGVYSDITSFTRSLSEDEKNIIQGEINNIYNAFLRKAALGRGMKVQELENYASGRVWSGVEAKEIRLTDIQGGMDDAVKIAAQKSGVGESYQIVKYPQSDNQLYDQLSLLMEEEEEAEFSIDYAKYSNYLNLLKKVKDIEGVHTRLPYEIIIK